MQLGTHMAVSSECGRYLSHNIIAVFYPESLKYTLVIGFLKCPVPYPRTAEQQYLIILMREMILQIHGAQYRQGRAIRVAGNLDTTDIRSYASLDPGPDVGMLIGVNKTGVYPDFRVHIVIGNAFFPKVQVYLPVLGGVGSPEGDI